MRCYEVTNKIVEGLPLVGSSDNIYALICGRGGVVTDRAARLPLSPALRAKVAAATADGTLAVNRLLQCDYEQTSELWLTPEREKRSDALVLYTSHYRNHENHGVLAFVSSGETAILKECAFMRDFEYYPLRQGREADCKRSGLSALIHLRPGSRVYAVETFRKKRLFKDTIDESKEVLATLSMRNDGTVDFEFSSQRAAYIWRIGAGAPPARFDDQF
jgi:hypothetical protein